uniref:Protein SMG5-like n=1 Tax=Phallusia mammillata TaxID=59560 RepID=A0A6F9DSH1_9ASCI|nr:protein SMG5-like [Phallusia mammillata]
MSRSSADYSAKHTVSPEVKSISAKRLYRGVLECVKKLDAGHQHRRSLISLFQPNQVKLRHKLREACERLLFTYPNEYGRKAEELLWKKVYYDVIHTVKSGRKFQSNAPGALQQRHLEPHFRQFLYSAMGFYHYLLLRLQSKVSSGLVEIDFSLATRPLHGRSNLSSGHTNYGMSKNSQDEDEKDLEEWMISTSYRILVCLGDLSRYQMEFGGSRSRPNRFYQLALLARPNSGMPHNQMATLSGHHSWWGLVAAYHYCRALHAEITFEGAEGNLQKLLDRNKKLFYQLPTEALDTIVSADVYKKEHTRIFIISFLYLCDLLRPKTYATDVEIAGLCKRLIDALIVCLTNINNDPQDSEADAVEEKSMRLADTTSNVNNSRHVGNTKRNSAGAHKQESTAGNLVNQHTNKYHHHTQQHRLNESIVFKICVLSLVNVHDLQTCRSNRSSAAIAFALAFFSHLLGHLVQCLSKAELADSALSNGTDSKAEGDGKSGKSRKSKVRMRRRRRVGGRKGGVDGDLSEGEDTMAGGDAVSDPELTEDSDSDSDTFSESSGSGTRLSQEDLSSHDGEESDTPDAEHPDKKFQPPETKKSSSQSGELPQQNVASLQDLSNKMFQPSSLRRKITLAPSFLQHLSSPAKPAKVAEKDKTDDVLATSHSTLKVGDKEKDETTSKMNDDNNTEKKPVQVERTDAEKEASVRRLRHLSRHHHVTAAMKLLADWLWANERVAVACAKSSRALWSRLVCFVNLLPTEKEMMTIDEIRDDPILSEQLKSITAQSEPEKGENEKENQSSNCPKPESGDTDSKQVGGKTKISIQKREKDTAVEASRWRQTRPLPEDHVVYNMNAVRDANVKSGINLSKSYTDMSDIQQVVMRTCRLRQLCRALSHVDDIDIDVINGTEPSGDVIGGEQFTGPEEEAVDPQMELEAVEAMRKHRLMKDMATSRLRSEVEALESSLGNQRSRDSALCLHLVPTVAALCHELNCVRKLVASERFFVTIPKTVVDGLDFLKKESPGAREAIRYLESEFKRGNRYIRAQGTDEEAEGCAKGEPPKLRRTDMAAWRLYRILECCRFLMQKEAKKTKTDVSEHNGIVAILTRETDSYTTEQSTALAAAKSLGIQVNSALTFSKSWTKIET